MTRENLLRYGKEYLHDLETACCEIGELHLNFVRESIKALEQGLCMDAVSREAVLDEFDKWVNSREKYYEHPVEFARSVMSLPPVTPERTTITYKDCSEAMLKMWIDNVLTDGQYNKIMDKLNATHLADMRGG